MPVESAWSRVYAQITFVFLGNRQEPPTSPSGNPEIDSCRARPFRDIFLVKGNRTLAEKAYRGISLFATNDSPEFPHGLGQLLSGRRLRESTRGPEWTVFRRASLRCLRARVFLRGLDAIQEKARLTLLMALNRDEDHEIAPYIRIRFLIVTLRFHAVWFALGGNAGGVRLGQRLGELRITVLASIGRPNDESAANLI